MRRRQFLTLLSFPLLAGAAQSAKAEANPAVEFVGDLYTRQLQFHLAKTGLGGEFETLFTHDMRALMNAPRVNLSKTPEGPKLHAFFGWGILPGMDIRIDQVASASGPGQSGWVRVDLGYRGEQHHVLVRPVREDDAWRIADIIYENRGSLSDRYRQMTGR
jgi:hypothetical protein